MKISVILGHPKKGSFNHAIADKVIQTLLGNGYKVTFHDLYNENFNPILPWEEIIKGGELDPIVQAHCQEIVEAEGIIIIHPNWWGQPPAILKGWVDRVFRSRVAYRFVENDKGEVVSKGLLKAKAALVFNTSNTPKEREQNVFGDPLEGLWNKCIFELCGIQKFYRKMYGEMITSSLEQRKEWLEDVEKVVNNYFPGK